MRPQAAWPLADDPTVLSGGLPVPVDDGAATLILSTRRVEHVLYPVFPPDRAAEDTIKVLEWMGIRTMPEVVQDRNGWRVLACAPEGTTVRARPTPWR